MLNKIHGPSMQKGAANACFSLLYFLLMCFTSSGQSGATFFSMEDTVLFSRKLSGVTHATNTIESRFIQEKHLEVISEKIVSKGLFSFRKENMLRWEYTDPLSYLIIMNGDKVLIRDEQKESRFDASSNKVFLEINAIMLGAIRGTILKEDKKFKIDYLENNQYNLVRMRPLSQQLKNYIAEMRIYFNKTSYQVSKLEMEEPSGDFTKIEFTGLKVNIQIPDEKFSVR